MNSELTPFDPTAVVTTTLTLPAACAGSVAVIDVSLTPTTLLAAVPPKVTPVTPVKSMPVRVTVSPPAGRLSMGLTDARVGAA